MSTISDADALALIERMKPIEGVSSGPWFVGNLDRNGQSIVESEHIELFTGWHHCVGSIEKEMYKNADHIARCDPQSIEALRALAIEAMAKTASLQMELSESVPANFWQRAKINAEKFKDQVIDTCKRAGQAEAERDALRALAVEAVEWRKRVAKVETRIAGGLEPGRQLAMWEAVYDAAGVSRFDSRPVSLYIAEIREERDALRARVAELEAALYNSTIPLSH